MTGTPAPNESLSLLTVSYYSWDYIRFLSFTAENLAESGWKEWLIIDNTPNEAQAELLSRLPRVRLLPKGLTEPCLSKAPRYQDGHSQDYACAVNQLYKHVETEYALLIDPDVAILRRSWDKILIDEMESTGYDAIGAPYHPYKWQKYAGYPCVIFLFMRAKLLQDSDFDFCSYSRNPISRRFEYFLHRYQYLINRFYPQIVRGSSQDVGWRLPHLFRANHSRTTTFDIPFIKDIDYYYEGPLQKVKPKDVFTRPGDGLFSSEDIFGSDYEEFWHQSALFATHHGAASQDIKSGKTGWESDKTQLWFSRIMDYTGLSTDNFVEYLSG